MAALSRIVTLENATLTIAGDLGKRGVKKDITISKAPLTIQATLQTYRYMDESAAPKAAPPKKPGAAKK